MYLSTVYDIICTSRYEIQILDVYAIIRYISLRHSIYHIDTT